jgi:hypothetical protein
MKNAGSVARKLPRLLVILAGVITGCAMACLGVSVRLQDAIPTSGIGAWYGTMVFTNMGWTAWRVGWALVLEGTFWVAAMAAWGLRNRWGWWTALVAGVISLIFVPGGTLAGIFVLIMLIPFLLHDRPWIEARKQPAEKELLKVVEPAPASLRPSVSEQALGEATPPGRARTPRHKNIQ